MGGWRRRGVSYIRRSGFFSGTSRFPGSVFWAHFSFCTFLSPASLSALLPLPFWSSFGSPLLLLGFLRRCCGSLLSLRSSWMSSSLPRCSLGFPPGAFSLAGSLIVFCALLQARFFFFGRSAC